MVKVLTMVKIFTIIYGEYFKYIQGVLRRWPEAGGPGLFYGQKRDETVIL